MNHRVIQLQPRDQRLLHGLLESRVMTTSQIANCYFDGKTANAYKRIQSLVDAGLLNYRPRPSASMSRVLFLTKRGLDAVESRLLVPMTWHEMEGHLRKLTDKYLAHELAVVDVKIALNRAIASNGSCKLLRFSTWPRLHDFVASGSDEKRHIVRAGAFCRIARTTPDGPITRDFFVELDRSTETVARVIEKIWRYRWFINSGNYARKCRHAPRGRPIDSSLFQFTVLVVVPSEQRRDHLAAAMLAMSPPVRKLVWLTTLDELLLDPVANTWMRHQDLLAANRSNQPISKRGFFDDTN